MAVKILTKNFIFKEKFFFKEKKKEKLAVTIFSVTYPKKRVLSNLPLRKKMASIKANKQNCSMKKYGFGNRKPHIDGACHLNNFRFLEK